MSQTPFEQAVTRVASRYLSAETGGRWFVNEVERALDILKDAIDIAEHRTSDNYETGGSLADDDSNVAHAAEVIRNFSHQVAPILRRIR